MGLSIRITCAVTVMAMLLAGRTASAQKFGVAGKVQPNPNAIGGLELPGPDEPEFPPPSVRVHRRVLYIEGSQQSDVITVWDHGDELQVTVDLLATGENLLLDWVDIDDVDLIVMFGLAGDDWMASQSSIPCIPIGGLGQDYYMGPK